MYQAVYDDTGVLACALRFDDRDLVARCQRFIQDLYEVGQPLASFLTSQVAVLPPPLQT